MTHVAAPKVECRRRWRRVAIVPVMLAGLLAAPSAGQENWVRFEFRLKDASTGADLKGRVYYISDLAADWFHPDNTQPLLPPGTYRVVAWERNYWQTEETLVVDPRRGLRQQKTMTLREAAPKRNDASRLVPEVLSSLVVVGNAVQKMPHMNRSWFAHNNIGNFHILSNAWSEHPGGINGVKIASATVDYDITHDVETAKQRFEFQRPRFKQTPSKGQRITGPVAVGLGDEALQISVDTDRPDGRPGNYHENRRYLVRAGNVVLQINLSRNLDAPYITSAQELVRRVRALDMNQVKRILEPEPFPWPKLSPRPGAVQATGPKPGVTPPGPPVATADAETPVPADAVADLPFTPAELATAAGLAGGTALVGSLLLLGVSGVRRDEVIEAIRDLLRGRLPEDPFEAWKKKYEALGWRYSEKSGVATFDPVDGARNEAGEVYSSACGGFVTPEGDAAPVTSPAPPKDGDVNDRGEVWSSFSGGYVDRKTFDQDMASRAGLADKARRDLADMARPDADVADLHRVIAETRRQGEEMRTFFTARDQLMDALAEGRRREGIDAILDPNREKLFDDLSERLRDVPDGAGGKDYRRGLENLVPLADVIGNQMRPGYQPTYTYRDALHDTVLQTGALALDAVLTKGAASSAVGGGLAMRDAARSGADTAGILAAGAKALATDYLFGKTVHLGAGLAGDALQAARGAARTVTDTVSDALASTGRRSPAASDLVERMKRSLDTLDAGVHRESSGRLRASLSDVLDVQRNPHQVRALQHSGSSATKEAFDNTLRNEVYRPHDQMLLEKLRQSSPDLADTKLMVHEVRTPGKAGSAINTDRDFRVLRQDASGQWIEVPKTKWEPHSHDVFAELTHFDASKCPKGMSPAQQKAWWAEQHGHTPTDRAFREAGRDYSDQAVDAFGRRTQLDKPRIAELKDIAAKAKDIADGKLPVPAQKVTLADPQGFAHQFHEKVTGNLRRGDPFEAIAQAKKGVETLDTVRTAYGAQKIATGALPSNLRQAMDVVKASDLPRLPDAAALGRLEADLGRLGFSGIDDFSAKLSSQFEGLKWAR